MCAKLIEQSDGDVAAALDDKGRDHEWTRDAEAVAKRVRAVLVLSEKGPGRQGRNKKGEEGKEGRAQVGCGMLALRLRRGAGQSSRRA